jgi:hypothetical protein
MAVKDKTPGEIRFFTYWIIFPDGDEWVDQVPFVHDLQWELKNSCFELEPVLKHELQKKGDIHWKDHNGITHRVKIESVRRSRRWGVGNPLMQAKRGPRRKIIR